MTSPSTPRISNHAQTSRAGQIQVPATAPDSPVPSQPFPEGVQYFMIIIGLAILAKVVLGKSPEI